MIHPNALFDLEYLNSMAAGDADMWDTLLDLLQEELPRERAGLQAAMESGDVEAVFQSSHSLKSTLAYTGNQQAMELNTRLESATREGRWRPEEEALVVELDRVINQLIAALPNLARKAE